jgi:hypothetical protein
MVASQFAWLEPAAVVGSYLGNFPVMLGLTAVLGYWVWANHRSWREPAVLVWALLGSEVIGLLLFALVRKQGVEPARTFAWPHGFAGLAPLRAAAVLGTAAWMIQRVRPSWGHGCMLVAGMLIMLIGMSVVWLQEQWLTQVVLEYACGGLLLFVGLWWLEGYGPGFLEFDVRPAVGSIPAEESE